MGTVHETGHGRYEQNLPRDWLGQPVAEARSMALHESQSLSFEMQLGSHPGFVALLAPLVAQAFGDAAGLRARNLHRLLTRVKPGSSASTPTRSPTRRTSSCATRSSAR
jgi:carboxypeptidase Taq